MATDDYDDLDRDQPGDSQAIKDIRARNRELARNQRAAEDRARELEAKAAEADRASRELAFLKAGVNPDDPAARYFVKGYDGELTPDAIKAAATEARIISPAQDRQAELTAQALQQHAAIADAGRSGSVVTDDGTYAQELAQAKSLDEVIAIANRHDPRNRFIAT